VIGVPRVRAVHDADKDPDLVVRGETRGRVAGILDGGIGDFQEQPYLGIQDSGCFGRDLEEEGIEFVDLLEKTAPSCVDESGLALLRVKISTPIPALAGNFSNAMASLCQILPEGMHIRGAGIAASKADNRHILPL